MKKTKLTALFLFLLVLLAAVMQAGPVARVPASQLTAAADLVVIGSVDITYSAGLANGQLTIGRVLKGQVSGSSLPISYRLPQGSIVGPNSQSSQGYGLFFFKKAGTLWTLIPATNGDAGWADAYLSLPRTLPSGLRESASAGLASQEDPLEAVYLELALASEAGQPPREDLVAAFRASRSKVLSASFGRMRSDQSSSNRIVALRALLAVGDETALSAMQQASQSLTADAKWSTAVEELRVYFTNPSKSSIQTLGAMAGNAGGALNLRTAAAGALARMHPRQSLPYLALLLDSPDLNLQSLGVGGLASFANNVPIGGHEPAPGDWAYRTDDTIAHSAFDATLISQRKNYYVDFWRSWWQTKQSELTAP